MSGVLCLFLFLFQCNNYSLLSGYHDIVLIPTGSTSINFHEVESSMANLLGTSLSQPLCNIELLFISPYHLEKPRHVQSSSIPITAVRNMKGEYLLNGNFQLHPEGQVHLAGTTFNYSHQPQSLQAEGPTDQPLYVVVRAYSTRLY